MANISDRITETFNGQNPTSTTVSGSRAIGGTTLACNSLAGWPTTTAIHFATYKKDSTGAKVAGSQTDWKGIVAGSSINTLTRQGGAADGGNGVGDIVEMMPTYSWANDLAKGLENIANPDGTLKSGLTIASPTLTTPTLTTPTSNSPILNSPTFGGTPATGTLSAIALTNPYKFSVWQSGAQNLGTGSFTKLNFDSAEFDTGSNFDIVTNRIFTAPITGFYQFEGCGDVSAATAGTLNSVAIYKNGSLWKQGSTIEAGANTDAIYCIVSALISLTKNDTIALYGYSSGTTIAVGVGQASTYFIGYLVSAT